MRFFAMAVGVASPEVGQRPPRVAAYVSCWINDPNRDGALRKATSMIREHGWEMVEIVEDREISREDYADKAEGLQYYEQALVDGEVLVFFVPKQVD